MIGRLAKLLALLLWWLGVFPFAVLAALWWVVTGKEWLDTMGWYMRPIDRWLDGKET
jgi:hypothetical protein